jgi:hypothetical protein
MLKGKSFDPCAEGNVLENACDLMKNNGKSKGLQLVNWIIIAVIIVLGDVLKWFPQIMALFPDEFTYDVVNLVLDLFGVVALFIMLGLPGLISLLKLVDSVIIFWLGSIMPELLPLAFWVEIIPAFSISLIVYYLYKSLVRVEESVKK